MLIKDCIDKFIEYIIIEERINENKAIELYNLIECELAQEYFPIYKEETWPHYPKVYYKEFSNIPIRIMECENKTYSLQPEFIISKDLKPLGKVKYSYLPTAKVFSSDKSEYDNDFCKCIVWGMISEYYLQKGEYEKAYEYSLFYKREISSLYENKNNMAKLSITKGIYRERNQYWRIVDGNPNSRGMYLWHPVKKNIFGKWVNDKKRESIWLDNLGFNLIKAEE